MVDGANWRAMVNVNVFLAFFAKKNGSANRLIMSCLFGGLYFFGKIFMELEARMRLCVDDFVFVSPRRLLKRRS